MSEIYLRKYSQNIKRHKNTIEPTGKTSLFLDSMTQQHKS